MYSKTSKKMDVARFRQPFFHFRSWRKGVVGQVIHAKAIVQVLEVLEGHLHGTGMLNLWLELFFWDQVLERFGWQSIWKVDVLFLKLIKLRLPELLLTESCWCSGRSGDLETNAASALFPRSHDDEAQFHHGTTSRGVFVCIFGSFERKTANLHVHFQLHLVGKKVSNLVDLVGFCQVWMKVRWRMFPMIGAETQQVSFETHGNKMKEW